MEQTLAEAIGCGVRAEMARKGLTQRKLAEALGMSQPQITKRIAGRIEFRPSELEKAAELLGIPMTRFLPPELAGLAA
jgi:transcriptional regulator with XRE-family HTH domain